MIIGEGYHKIRLSGKDNQADAFLRESLEQIIGGSTRLLQPGRPDIIGFHRPRYIDGYQKIPPIEDALGLSFS